MRFLFLFSFLIFWATGAMADGYQGTGQRSQAINAQMNTVEEQHVTAEAAHQDYASLRQAAVPSTHPVVAGTASSHWLHDIFFSGQQQLDPRKVNTLEIGSAPYYYLYKEPDAHVKTSGVMTEYYLNYAYRPPDGNILNNTIINTYKFEGRYALGTLDYKGSGTHRSPNYNYELRALLGKDYLLADHSLVTPYIGFGYRYLLDKGNGILTTTSSGGVYAYDRRSNYYYLPIGVSATIPYKSWTTAFNLEYDIFINGWQVSDLSDGDQFNHDNNPNIHNFQDSGYGIRGSFKLMYDTPRLDFYFEPFVRYWSIERSSLVSATVDGSFSNQWNEPANTTLEVGSRFGLEF
ncbi:MAG: hypothetical protein KGI24_07845 [Candidatus Omnitrophica bacterium]|nr:hypothetical protein [Candidatus Omnitrophota bacterium]